VTDEHRLLDLRLFERVKHVVGKPLVVIAR
jgi:hypothetical protein